LKTDARRYLVPAWLLSHCDALSRAEVSKYSRFVCLPIVYLGAYQ